MLAEIVEWVAIIGLPIALASAVFGWKAIKKPKQNAPSKTIGRPRHLPKAHASLPRMRQNVRQRVEYKNKRRRKNEIYQEYF